MLLKNKVVIVSGIGPGLGIKLAVEAAREGARAIIVAARTQAKLDDAKDRIRSLGVDCDVLKVRADITVRQQCADLVGHAVERFGRIDALLNSAYAHGDFEPVATADLQGWRSIFETNVFGTMNLTVAVVQQMEKQHGGAIAMINTQAVRKPFAGEAGYAASKGALAVAAKYLAQELGPKGIRVNSVHMGWMWGAPVQDYVARTAAQQQVSQEQIVGRIVADIPLGHIPTDDDCAKAALFLVSDYANAVTGASLDANGGGYMPQ
jgi:NAD(P)-dependent dehydrogenase (short-subunit alcohol dehydrogenase family)